MKRPKAVQVAVASVIAAIAIAVPIYSQPFFNLQLTGAFVIAVAVLGLNMLLRFTGQVSLGHSCFFAIGAYTTAVLVKNFDWSAIMTMPMAALLTLGLGFVFGIPALRLRGFFLALITLGLALVTPPILKRFDSVTGGSKGINVPSLEAPAWTGLANDQFLYFVALASLTLACLLAYNFGHSRWGRTMLMVKENEQVAQALGIHVGRAKTSVFAWSAMFAGLAGALSTNVYAYVSPESFTASMSIELVIGAIVGGVGSISGALYGALFVKFVPFYADEVNQALSGLIYGVMLIVIMLIVPGGVASLVTQFRNRVSRHRSNSSMFTST